MPGPKKQSLEYVKSNFKKFYNVDKDGCWMWHGTGKRRFNYGKVRIDGVRDNAHRWSYRIFKGEIPKNLFILHSCNKPGCVNPEHLRAGSQLENIKDIERSGRKRTAYGKFSDSHCPHGHEMVGSNCRRRKNGARYCGTCSLIRSLEYQRKKRKPKRESIDNGSNGPGLQLPDGVTARKGL